MKIIEYYHYSKWLSESKDGKKHNYKGIKFIKEFIKKYVLYILKRI